MFGLDQSFVRLESVGCIPQLPLGHCWGEKKNMEEAKLLLENCVILREKTNKYEKEICTGINIFPGVLPTALNSRIEIVTLNKYDYENYSNTPNNSICTRNKKLLAFFFFF